MPYKNLDPAYYSWANMVQRCHNPHHAAFKWYGARGIQVCQAWRDSFAVFLADMGPRPAGMTIDRIHVDGGYNPENCRWATHVEQQRNRSNTKLTQAKAEAIRAAVASGQTKTSVALEFGVSRTMVRKIREGKSWQP